MTRRDHSTRFRPGDKKRGGRAKGTPNKKTVIRQNRIKAAQKAVEELVTQVGVTPEQAGEIVARDIRKLRLGKDILSEFANSLSGMAAFYQPDPRLPVSSQPGKDEDKFRLYAAMAIAAAEKVAPFESPRLSAVAIGQAQVGTIKVEGGMPDEFSAPPAVQTPIPPLTVISAEDPEPTPPMKVVDAVTEP